MNNMITEGAEAVLGYLALAIGIDLDKLKVPPQSSLNYFRVGGAPAGPHAGILFEALSTSFSVRINFVYSPILFSACLYKSAIFAEESVVSHAGRGYARVLSYHFLSRLS